MFRVAIALVGGVLLDGCAAHSLPCADGTICPSNTVCVALATYPDNVLVDRCVQPTQLGECGATGTRCAGDTGTCHEGVCIPTACGNQLLDVDERCDDGNTSAGDDCSSDCRSTEVCGNHVVDLIKGETCDDANLRDHDTCSSTCNIETLRWSRRTPVPAVNLPELTFDSHRQRFVMFGGYSSTATTVGLSNVTWEWGDRWVPMLDVGPSGRVGHGFVYDVSRREAVLFGPSNDTWTLGASGWKLHTTTGAPSGREGIAIAYDAAHSRTILFGGTAIVTETGGNPITFDDTWVWNGTTWSLLDVAHRPPPLTHAAMTYDPVREVVVLFGGETSSGPTSSTYELVGNDWVRRATTGPSARARGHMVFDSTDGRAMLVGGGPVLDPNDMWKWDGTTWTQGPSLPVASGCGDLDGFGIAADSTRKRVLVTNRTGDQYVWNGTTWTTRIACSAARFPPRWRAAAVMLPDRGETLVYGGREIEDRRRNDTWAWDGGEWRELASPLPADQPGRSDVALGYDPIHQNVVMFGGSTGAGVLDETWVWDGVWTRRSPAHHPPARDEAMIAFDGVRGRMILVGGQSSVGAELGDMWSWDGTDWVEEAGSIPPARARAAMAWDPVRRVVMMFGGRSGGRRIDDTWTWNGTTWTPATSGPLARDGAGLAFDASLGHLVLAGGEVASMVPTEDVWEWDGAWHPLSPDTTRPATSGAAIVSAPDGAGILAIGGAVIVGATNLAVLDDIEQLAWNARPRSETCTAVDTDGDQKIGCADDDCWQVCHPACASTVKICDLPGPRCGDLTCDPLESCVNCPADCTCN